MTRPRAASPLSPASLALAVLAALATSTACSGLTSPPEPEPMTIEAPASASGAAPAPTTVHTAPAPTVPAPANAPPEAPLSVKDVVVGKGAEVKAGDKVRMQYTGTLTDGKEFDSSRKRNEPFEFVLGTGRVIKGWDLGIGGSKELGIAPMRVGGKRKLTIPPSLGYGARGMPPVIPAHSTLLFDVELVEIAK